MVFLIQKAQNKDAMAIQIKLNELIASSKMASNMIVNAEDLSEEELKVLNRYYSKLAEVTRKNPAKKSAHNSKIEQATGSEKVTG
jgi:low affinity Fe/Cu permease